MSSSSREVSHYVVTAHPPGAVHFAVKCNFLAPDSEVRRSFCSIMTVVKVACVFNMGERLVE